MFMIQQSWYCTKPLKEFRRPLRSFPTRIFCTAIQGKPPSLRGTTLYFIKKRDHPPVDFRGQKRKHFVAECRCRLNSARFLFEPVALQKELFRLYHLITNRCCYSQRESTSFKNATTEMYEDSSRWRLLARVYKQVWGAPPFLIYAYEKHATRKQRFTYTCTQRNEIHGDPPGNDSVPKFLSWNDAYKAH